MGYTVKGTIHYVGEVQHVSERFSKREFILSFADNPKYPQFAKMELSGDRCSQLDDISAGTDVEVEFQIRGRLYTSKKTGEEDCFTSLNAWKVQRVDESKSGGGGEPNKAPDDDIPFLSCSISDEPSAVAKVLRRP